MAGKSSDDSFIIAKSRPPSPTLHRRLKTFGTMEEDFQDSPVDEELQCSNTEGTQEERDLDPPQDQELVRVFQDQQNQSPESFKQDGGQLNIHSNPKQVDVQDEDSTKENEFQDEVEVKDERNLHPDQHEGQMEVQGVNHNPPDVHDGHEHGGLVAEEETGESDLSPVNRDLLGPGQIRGQCLDRASPQDENQAERRLVHRGDADADQDQDLTTAAANQDGAGESGGSVPAPVISQAEESRPAPAAPVGPPASPVEPSEPPRPERPADLGIPAAVNMSTNPRLSSSSDAGDMTCSDLLSLRSDSLSLASEPTISRRVSGRRVHPVFYRLW
ncbi:uncharacterized protein LOC120793095 [Xiphias gladius]|uniref:uncharacterized protein LOC120793095 n=1 Tax=Xiphias gladius TaxID=8245 RepID=UPI001A988F0B|nr:uncharacterized protein LOC120793095 [Xiphias gladius]